MPKKMLVKYLLPVMSIAAMSAVFPNVRVCASDAAFFADEDRASKIRPLAGSDLKNADVAAQPTLAEKVTEAHTAKTSPNSVTVEWGSVPDAEGYEAAVSYLDYSGSAPREVSYVAETKDASLSISLNEATICSYSIRFYKTLLGEKTYSEASPVFFAATQPKKTEGLLANEESSSSADNASISISWDKMNDASYKIYYKKSSESEYRLHGESKSNTYLVDGLTPSEKYDIRVQAYCLSEENVGDASDALSLYTCPAPVENIVITKEEPYEIGLSWNENPTGNTFYIYRSVNDSEYELYTTSKETTLSETNLNPGTVYSYKICSYSEVSGLLGPNPLPARAVTTPLVATGLAASENTATSIQLNWDYNETATGYVIYRRKASADFEYLAVTSETSYLDENLEPGRNYRYKIQSYADTQDHVSDFGEVEKTSTLPAQVQLKSKAGYGKLRLYWDEIARAEGYYVYELVNGAFVLTNTISDPKSTSIQYEGLNFGETHSYKVSAYRNAFEREYVSDDSITSEVVVQEPKITDTSPLLYGTKKKTINSSAWKNVPIVKKSANYAKSVVIPGLRSTNVNGFESTSMCPQGLAFAKQFMMISAYDAAGEENSVIYVIRKSTKKLRTVIVLPNKTHASGLAFDGENVWITNGKKICTLSFEEISAAAKTKEIFKCLNFTGIYNLEEKASFLTFYGNSIWTGDFEYSKNGTLRSYLIVKPNDGAALPSDGAINLVPKSTVTIPPAVQGIAFSKKNLMLSRAYAKTSEINIYRPTNVGKAGMKLGKVKKTVKMPALNEEIDVSGNYLYVNFESATAANSRAANHMDRVIAIKLKALLK